MLGLVLIYFIGKAFYELAEKFDKKKWLFAIVGAGSYYIGAFIAGTIIAIIIEVVKPGSIEEWDNFLLGLMAFPFGLLTCAAVYFLIKNYWTNEYGTPEEDRVSKL